MVVKDERWYVQVMHRQSLKQVQTFTCSKVLCVTAIARGCIHNVVEDVDVVFAVTHQGA